MNIAIDVSPLKTDRFLQHRVRGVGSYIENLKRSLERYYSNNTYTFFTRGDKLPKNIDLVHYTYFEPFFLTLPLMKAFPTVVTVHDVTPLVFPKHFPPGIYGSLKWIIQRLSLQKTAAIISDSACSKRDIVSYTHIPDAKIHVVYLAASDVFKPLTDRHLLERLRQMYKLPEKFVLYVGDVTWNKNVPRLIKAIKKINLTLVMAGKAFISNDFDRANPWNQDLQKVQDLIHDDSRFIRLGFVPEEDLAGLYNLATVFVMPSLYEGFGLPVLEAMTCGSPVVTTRRGSIPEVVGDAALFVDPVDTESIANGIGEVYFTKRLQKEIVQKGLARAKKFSWEKTVQETLDVYSSI